MLSMYAYASNASLILVDTQNWSSVVSPSSGKLSKNDSWIKTEQGTPTKTGNSSGALISDFRLEDDFSFTGIFSPTFATNISCERENTCNDNDIIGLVFGWQNEDNHYRLGWNQGGRQGVSDVTGRDGLFLVREIDGRSKTLVNYDSTFWVDEAVYQFSVVRSGSSLEIEIKGVTQDFKGDQSGSLPVSTARTATQTGKSETIKISVIDDTFRAGNVGVYTESQTGFFQSLSAQGTFEVSAPAFSMGFIFFALLRLRQKHARKVF